ncbi:hypothetical protein [Cognatishimia sp. F0-27]|uniref:hypothetical protein n=1 Tax=Cognatishimia sp. F0-27 TaxID=2816855 RepID=UPI001D0C4874|nr:hypothetical protein [Cognatishimia sp. F0-27]MCC1493428.1 hypothetical protein [Cognatishimia sp. F0-27]
MTQNREEIAEELAYLRRFLVDLRERLETGETDTPAGGGKLAAEIRYWIKAARDAEKDLDELRRQDCGISDLYGLDLDAARHAIGCRMARLRPCCGAGELSE